MSVIRYSATTIALLAALGGPAFAQQTAPVTPPAASANTNAPSGSLTKSHGDFRSSQLVGATVYADHDTSIGTIDNLLVDNTGKVTQAVISVGGFLGVGSKLVAVPFDQLKFTPSGSGMTGSAMRSASNLVGSHKTATDASASGDRYFSITLPGATKNSLSNMPTFSYGT